jgi:hypothetical protein
LASALITTTGSEAVPPARSARPPAAPR